MATITAGSQTGSPDSVNLSTGQTGNGQSTNVADRQGHLGAALLKIVSTVGASPTVTVAVEGSADGTDWFSIAYADPATPETAAVATFAITTATTTRKILRPNHPWRYLRLTYSANTNVTLTADVFLFDGRF
jgi:hypothetical protein